MSGTDLAREARTASRPVRRVPRGLGALALCGLLLAVLGLQGCGPLIIGGLIASSSGGGGDGGGDGTSTVNFTEVEPNDVAPGNLLGSIFPGRTFVVSGGHPPGSGDVDFFRIDATTPVRVQITLTPTDFSDLELLVGSVVDNGGPGVAETFVVDLNTGDVFSAGSREFNNGMSMYTMRLVGQSLAPPGTAVDPPSVPARHTTYIQLDERGEISLRLDVTDYVTRQRQAPRSPVELGPAAAAHKPE